MSAKWDRYLCDTIYLCDSGKPDCQNKNTMQFHFREVTHIIYAHRRLRRYSHHRAGLHLSLRDGGRVV